MQRAQKRNTNVQSPWRSAESGPAAPSEPRIMACSCVLRLRPAAASPRDSLVPDTGPVGRGMASWACLIHPGTTGPDPGVWVKKYRRYLVSLSQGTCEIGIIVPMLQIRKTEAHTRRYKVPWKCNTFPFAGTPWLLTSTATLWDTYDNLIFANEETEGQKTIPGITQLKNIRIVIQT